MHIGGTLTNREREHQLGPLPARGELDVVPRFGPQAESELGEGWNDHRLVEARHADLDVDAVLGPAVT